MSKKKQDENEVQQEAKVGLEWLSDETLAQIVESELREHDELQSNGWIALNELNRRDPNYGR